MTVILLVVVVLAGALAAAMRLRVWYYDRRGDRQWREFLRALTVRDELRSRCQELWWEGQL